MGQLRLKQEIIQTIKKNTSLFAQVADAAEVSVYTLPALLKRNDKALTAASVIRILKVFLNKDEDDLIELQQKAVA